jgi:predicted AlkP superfamily phosphohydrolase/phosphomutase
MVEMGPDRMHHGFWKDMDPEHRRHDPNGPHRDAILDYHRHLDGLVGALVDEHADDETTVLVVSDHGAKRMEGGIRINEWLRREGLLRTLREPDPERPEKLADLGVDWAGTTAWGEGGYYGRVFLNVAGREPDGIVPPDDLPQVLADLASRLQAIPGPDGEALATRVHRPEDVYDEVNGVAPDLLVLFGDLSWRAVGTLGGPDGVHTFENDTGPDDANHAQDGLLIMAGPGVEPGPGEGMHLLDVAPTVLELLGIAPLASMRGRSLLSRQPIA